MGYPIVTTVTIGAAVANGYAQSQKPLAGGNLTLNGSLVVAGVGTPDAPRRVAIASDADDSGRTFTVYGTARSQRGGIAIQETVTGPNTATVYTTQDFATVTRIAIDAASAGNLTAGTNSIASGPWVPWDRYGPPMQIAATGYVTSGAPTYQLDYTLDDVYGTFLPSSVPFPRAQAWGNMTGKTGTANTTVDQAVTATRLTLTDVGGVQLTQLQQTRL